jgi:AcrR family transcriptional regulator
LALLDVPKGQRLVPWYRARIADARGATALELFIEHGIAGASIEKIAKQAGVAKTSIYRRWASREALLAQAIEVARNATGYTIDLLERTSPRDLIKLLVEACEVIVKPEIRRLMARLIGSSPDYPELIEIYCETYYLPRRRAFVRALERAQIAGLLAENVSVRGRGGKSAVSARRVECPIRWNPARA